MSFIKYFQGINIYNLKQIRQLKPERIVKSLLLKIVLNFVQSKANNVSPKWTVMFFKSKYFETFYTFYISWFFLTFIDKIIIPIIKGATYINGSLNSKTIVGSLSEIIGYFLFFYFPIKLLVMLFNKKNKWPTNIAYHIIPYFIYFFFQFTNYYADNFMIN